MKYREKVNKNVKKREIWKLLPWQQQIHQIILLHSSVSITIIHPIIILTFNFDMLELSLYPICTEQYQCLQSIVQHLNSHQVYLK